MKSIGNNRQMIKIEVAFATINRQKVIAIEIPVGSKIIDAIKLAKINDFFPEFDLLSMPVGIFGKRVVSQEEYQLKSGDRIEIYRQLAKSPNQKRLERAKTK